MGKLAIIISISIIALVAVCVWSGYNKYNNTPAIKDLNNTPKETPTMLITSPSFLNSQPIPKKFTCDGSTPLVPSDVEGLTTGGGNINPELQIPNVPGEAKSLALIVDDPDATGGRTFTHWLLWNIDPKTTLIKEESKPPGLSADSAFVATSAKEAAPAKAESVEGKTDFGRIGYGGPCPPPGSKPHRYFFKLYALNAVLDLPEGASKTELESEISKHLIEKAELIGLYQR